MSSITRQDILNGKIRFFPFHTADVSFMNMNSIEVWYLINLLHEKSDKDFRDFKISTIYPFKIVMDNLIEIIWDYKEDVFIFYLENYFHSSDYLYNYFIKLLDRLRQKWVYKKIIVQSYKISRKESEDLINRFENVKIVIRTDIEYFINEFVCKWTQIDEIWNITYLNKSWKVISTKEQSVNYELWEYLFGSYYSGYLELLQEDILEQAIIISSNNNKKKYDTTIWSKFKQFHDTLKIKRWMICTGRWCKYKCMYCFRWSKFSKIRQIPIDVIKRDLDYLTRNWYDDIYIYDDCFLSTNYDRIDDILDLLSKYQFTYQTAIRYEILNENIFQKILKSSINKLQIWLQTINSETNKLIGRILEPEKFRNICDKLKKNWKKVYIDLIVWLPWDSLKDFIETLNFAVSLSPSMIAINTLFVNPWTELYKNKEKYGIQYQDFDEDRSDHIVPLIKQSNTFSEKDYLLAKKYIMKIAELNTNIAIVSR